MMTNKNDKTIAYIYVRKFKRTTVKINQHTIASPIITHGNSLTKRSTNVAARPDVYWLPFFQRIRPPGNGRFERRFQPLPVQ